MRSRQRGSSLLEGLISIVVFSVGVLGLGGLQFQLIASGTQSQYRAQASFLAEELLGLAAADAPYAGCYVVTDAGPGACGSALAAKAVADWRQRVLDTLPGAGATPPTASLDGGGNFTVTLLWQRKNEQTQHNYSATTNLFQTL